jgi:iron complex outermembrane receptor protein
MDVDLFDAEQVEVIKGPASLLYTKGAVGGVINVVDNTIAASDFEESTTKIGMETQSVNNGQVEFISHQSNVGGFNLSAAYKQAEFENFDLPKGALMHDEHDEHETEDHDAHGEDEHHEDEHDEGPITFLNNSGLQQRKLSTRRIESWGMG